MYFFLSIVRAYACVSASMPARVCVHFVCCSLKEITSQLTNCLQKRMFLKTYVYEEKITKYYSVWCYISSVLCAWILFVRHGGWSGGAGVLGKLSVQGHPTNLDSGKAGAYYAWVRVGVVLTFFSRLSFLSSFSLSLGVLYCLKWPLSPKTTNQPSVRLAKMREMITILWMMYHHPFLEKVGHWVKYVSNCTRLIIISYFTRIYLLIDRPNLFVICSDHIGMSCQV